MEYTPTERLTRLWELVEQDPDCLACQAEVQEVNRWLTAHTDHLRREEQIRYWALPTDLSTFYGRVLELVSREMRFPEETA